ncbi:MAG: dihydroxyacetone kinase phosphoryl donor subunit DhaM [Solirubrobacterales bacterium]
MMTVGIVVVSHSPELAAGTAALAREMAADSVEIIPVGGDPHGGLGTDEGAVRSALAHADSGEGVVVVADLGSSLLTVRQALESRANNGVRLADAPIVEGAVAAAVMSSAGRPLDEVLSAAEETRGANKL